MKCPICGGKTKVIDSRKNQRRRECINCLTRFNTTEKIIMSSLDKHLMEMVIHGKESC